MDKHYLTPLFSPQHVLVFAASAEQATDAYAQAQAQVLRDNLTAQRFTGEMTFVDIHTSGTLADLAHTRARCV